MASHIELLLTRNVEHLGIIGDVVKVRPGYARNYLLPLRMAEAPTPEKIEALKEKRTAAMAEVAQVRNERAAIIQKLEGHTIVLTRACNDQGQLYGAVTHRDIFDQLITEGFAVDIRAVRLDNPLRRVSQAHCLIQFDRELKADITVIVKADRVLEYLQHYSDPTPSSKESESNDAGSETEEKAPKAAKAAKGEKAEEAEKAEKAEKSDSSDKDSKKGKKKAKA
ncbi:MAG: 50S ribosomal protein L9 [Planctomycetota bacterium]|nr:50S ribosomal protein L9 [Planctomycetota bacterium]